MSKKGKRILLIPEGIKVEINPNDVVISNTKSQTLKVEYPAKILKVINENNSISIEKLVDTKFASSIHGTINALIENAIIGLSKGYRKSLKIVGVGYKAMLAGTDLKLNIGFSHPVIFKIPTGITVTCPTTNEIIIDGYDKIVVGEFAAKIREKRKPEPYKGKGIMYTNEVIIRKAGKTAESKK